MDRNEFISRLFERAAQRAGQNRPDSEAYYSAGSSFEVQVRQGEILQYNVADSVGLGFRMLNNGRMGYASTQILDDAAIDLLVEGAMENAALIESEDEQFLFAGSETYPSLELYNPGLEKLDAARKIEMALELERLTLAQDARVQQVEDCCIFSSSGESWMVNTRGLNVTSRDNLLGGYVVAIAREGDQVNTGMKMFAAMDPAEIDLQAVAAAAAQEALDGLNAAPVPSGTYRVVLRSDVAATMLATFSGIFSAESAQRGLSRLKGREGESIAAGCVSIIDNPHLAGSASSTPFDGEGVATRVKRVVDQGRLNTLLHNLKTAHKQGVETTANASRASYAATVGVAPSNFYFEPSSHTLAQLLADAGDGLLITNLMGMHSGANSITGDFSLAARGFRIRAGQLAEPVAQITIAGNFYALLQAVEAVGDDLEFRFPGASRFGSPSLLISSLSIAGS